MELDASVNPTRKQISEIGWSVLHFLTHLTPLTWAWVPPRDECRTDQHTADLTKHLYLKITRSRPRLHSGSLSSLWAPDSRFGELAASLVGQRTLQERDAQ